jgi:hypothetical protein
LSIALFRAGCASFNVALHCLSMRLPLHIAAPFAAAKAAAALALLPQHVAYLSLPQIKNITSDVKQTVDLVYNTALGLFAGTGSCDAALPAVAPCPQLALMLWFSMCLACLLPLYCLAVMEWNSRHAAGSSNSLAAAAAQAASDAGDQDLQQLAASITASRAPDTSSSSSSSAAAATAEVPATPIAAAPAGQASFLQQQQQQRQLSWGGLLSSAWCSARHAFILFLASCFLWAVVDVGVAAVVPACGKKLAAAV